MHKMCIINVSHLQGVLMNANILLAITLIAIGIEHFTPLPNWVVGILAVLTGILLLLGV